MSARVTMLTASAVYRGTAVTAGSTPAERLGPP
jgi:hypothetical protein